MDELIDKLSLMKLSPELLSRKGAKIISITYCKVSTPAHILVFESVLTRINNCIIERDCWHYYALAGTLLRFSYNFREENIRRHYPHPPELEHFLAVGKCLAICMRMFVSIMGRYCRINDRFMRYHVDLFAELQSLTSSQIIQIINYFASYKHVTWRIDLLRKIRSQFHEMFLIPVKKLANYSESMVDEFRYADINDISLYVIIIVLLMRYRRRSQLSDSDCSLITAITIEAFGQFKESTIIQILHRDKSVYDSVYRRNEFDTIPYSCWDDKTMIRTDRYVERVYSAEHDKLILSIMLGSSAGIAAMLINTNRQTGLCKVVNESYKPRLL